MAKISPDGRYLAELWNKREDNTRFVTIKDLSKADRPIISSTGDSVVRPYSISWANNKRLLIHLHVPYRTDSVRREQETEEDFNIYDYFMFSRTVAIDPDGSNLVQLMEDDRKARRNVSLSKIRHFLPKDPEHILMTAWRNERLALLKVNVYTGDSKILTSGGRLTYAFINDEEGNLLYRLDYLRIAKRIDIFELDEDNDWYRTREIDLEQEEEDDENTSLADLIGLYENKLVYRQRNSETGFYELIILDDKNSEPELLASSPNKDILYPLTSTRSNNIIGYAFDGDVITYKFFDKEIQAQYEQLQQKIGLANYSITSFTDDGSTATVNVYGGDNPGMYFIYHLESNKLEFLQNRYFNIASKNLSLISPIDYTTRDGLSIRSYLYHPENLEDKLYPLIIMPHGGPHARDRATYDDFAQLLATRGYLVLKPNFRGSLGFGKAFEEAGYKQWGQAMQDDLTDGINELVKGQLVDPKRVCIVGISYGGYAAMMGIAKDPDLYQCAVAINGISDLHAMIEFDEGKLDDKQVERYVYRRVGHPEQDAKMLSDFSPINHIDKIKAPLLLIAGTDDDVVDYDQSDDMFEAMKEKDKTVKFITLEDTGHNPFYYHVDIEVVYNEVVEFLDKHL
ncbi:alpha/beta hydrolase family protein [Glaciecola sp. 1036]|uniref:alpha/beta hydrolase family protein n=1 Tax=Alteromonadaceae TaxID=72275 RepID=UPI003D0839CD